MSTSKYFKAYELVDQDVYNLLGDDSYKLIDPMLLETIDVIREILGVPLICNNWKHGGSRDLCGYRNKTYSIGAPNSYHKKGQAVDLISTKMSAKEIRKKLEENKHLLPYPIRIEKWDDNGEINWVHIDLGNTKGQKIYFFKA